MRERVAPAPPVMGMLDLLKLNTPDVSGTLDFYREVLGATVIEEALPHWARLRLASVDLGLHLGEASTESEAGCEPHFRVHSVAAWRSHLAALGVRIERDVEDIPGGVLLTFRDPAGNRIALVQYGVSADEVDDDTQ